MEQAILVGSVTNFLANILYTIWYNKINMDVNQGHQVHQVHSPAREEWALLNKFKALQFERMKQKDWQNQRDKKLHFKQELDTQLTNKDDKHRLQIEEDRRYYQFITRQAEQFKAKEERVRAERAVKMRQVKEQNQQALQHLRNSRNRSNAVEYALEIGLQSQREHKQKTMTSQRQMMDTLDMQLREKQLQMVEEREKTRKMDQVYNQYQSELFTRRSAGKKYGQNFQVYNIYDQLNARKNYELARQQSMSNEVAEMRRRQEAERKAAEERKRHQLTEEVKSTLDSQIKVQNWRKAKQGQFNPQEVSYEVIGNIFRPKQQTYNKQKYSRELKAQAEEQRRRRMNENFMSEHQYRINMNQLNKAVTGEYSHQTYIDRSLSAIGGDKIKQEKDKIADPDAQIIKRNLDGLRKKFVNIESPSENPLPRKNMPQF